MGAFDHLERTYDGAFEQLFSLGSGEFEQNFPKIQMPGGCPGGGCLSFDLTDTLVPAATEKVSLIRSNIVWNRWKSTLRAGSIRVNLNHGTEM